MARQWVETWVAAVEDETRMALSRAAKGPEGSVVLSRLHPPVPALGQGRCLGMERPAVPLPHSSTTSTLCRTTTCSSDQSRLSFSLVAFLGGIHRRSGKGRPEFPCSPHRLSQAYRAKTLTSRCLDSLSLVAPELSRIYC